MNQTIRSSVNPVLVSQAVGTIGVLMGGFSSEREISLRSGQAVLDALIHSGHKAIALEIISDNLSEIKQSIIRSGIELAFIALHGKFGEDGTIQSMLDDLNIVYTGSGALASACAFNKVSTQTKLRSCGLPVADFYVVQSSAVDIDAVIKALKQFPLVVKPSCEGSSFGVNLARNQSELQQFLQEAFRYGPEVIVEKYIEGRELTVGILGDQALAIVEIRPQKEFFDFEAKYQKGMTDYLVPAPLDKELAQRISSLAIKTHQTIGCEGYSRVDFRLDGNHQPYILEINTIPGFTQTSLFPKAARESGIEFSDVCIKLIHLAYGKKK